MVIVAAAVVIGEVLSVDQGVVLFAVFSFCALHTPVVKSLIPTAAQHLVASLAGLKAVARESVLVSISGCWRLDYDDRFWL